LAATAALVIAMPREQSPLRITAHLLKAIAVVRLLLKKMVVGVQL
jgi:hypothetical protein